MAIVRGELHLRSRNDNDVALRYPRVFDGRRKLPDETVIDGEVVAFDEAGRPSFKCASELRRPRRPSFYVFDLLMLQGRDVRRESLVTRRELLEEKVLRKLTEPVRYLIAAARRSGR